MTTAAPKGGRVGQRADRAQSQTTAYVSPSVPEQLRRRRAASWRLPPLESGLRDPLGATDEPITDAVVASWRAAWCHISRAGLQPIIPDRLMAAIRGRNEAP